MRTDGIAGPDARAHTGKPGDSGSSVWGCNQGAKILAPALLFPGGATLNTLLSLHELVFYKMGAVLSISKCCCEDNMSQCVSESMSPSGAESHREPIARQGAGGAGESQQGDHPSRWRSKIQLHGGAPGLSPWDENYGRQRCSPQRETSMSKGGVEGMWRADGPPMALHSVPCDGLCVPATSSPGNF